MAHEPWDAGRAAWKRLARWFGDEDSGPALDALADIGLVRHLLDQAELRAVRTARRERASWAEIATKLGITRQAAWEKWRDLDGDLDGDDADRSPASEADRALTRVAAQIGRGRPRGHADVPDVVGMSFDDARAVLLRARLAAVLADPDAEPVSPAEWHSTVVVRQYPDSGTRVWRGSPVKLWVERGGGSAGVREPRRPPPPRRQASAEIDLGTVVGE